MKMLEAKAPDWGLYRIAEPRQARAQFVGMDILRAVASLMILLYHAHSIGEQNAERIGTRIFATPNWWVSVIELFFTMSGFLMVHMSYEMYGRPGAWKAFLLRRAVRTPPLYYLYTIGVFLIFLVIPSVADYPATLTRLFHSLIFYPGQVPPVIAIGWTLNYEVFFYILIGAFLFLRYPFGPIATAVTLIGLTILGQIFHPQGSAVLHLWTDRILLDFAIGIGIALLYYDRIVIGAKLRWLLVIVAVLLFSIPFDPDGPSIARPLIFGTAMGIFVAIMTMREDQPSFGPFQGMLVKFGSRAYTLYLSHILCLKLFEKVYFRFFSGQTAIYLYIILASVFAVIVAAILYEMIERPMTKWLQGWAKRHGSYSIR